jgi:glycosyltransferase involved in cell wall biosynthesis
MGTVRSILIISPFFSPNIGGVETHLDDLVESLNNNGYHSYVLTYSPLTTQGIPWIPHETRGNCQIYRYRWFGKSLFHILENYPLFDFLYLTPYLFLRSLFWMTINHRRIDTIHSHGINAAFVGTILSRIFAKKHITQTHAIYEHISGLSKILSVKIFNQCSSVLCLSQRSLSQLRSWRVNIKLLHLYRYWLNLNNFHPSKKLPPQFTVLYAGRLIDKKGIPQLLAAAKLLPKIKFIIVGNGPSQEQVSSTAKIHPNITYLGPIPYSDLPNIYRQASILCIPSQYPEGFGRVVLESVASGLPVIGSNLGSIGEAVDPTVSILFSPTVKNITANIKRLSSNNKQYLSLQRNCRAYALKHFSQKNFSLISDYY